MELWSTPTKLYLGTTGTPSQSDSVRAPTGLTQEGEWSPQFQSCERVWQKWKECTWVTHTNTLRQKLSTKLTHQPKLYFAENQLGLTKKTFMGSDNHLWQFPPISFVSKCFGWLKIKVDLISCFVCLTVFFHRADLPQPDNRAAGENPPHPEVCIHFNYEWLSKS